MKYTELCIPNRPQYSMSPVLVLLAIVFSEKRDSISETPGPYPYMLLGSSPALGSWAPPAWAHRAVLAMFLVWY